jgi:hypothetical protein
VGWAGERVRAVGRVKRKKRVRVSWACGPFFFQTEPPLSFSHHHPHAVLLLLSLTLSLMLSARCVARDGAGERQPPPPPLANPPSLAAHFPLLSLTRSPAPHPRLAAPPGRRAVTAKYSVREGKQGGGKGGAGFCLVHPPSSALDCRTAFAPPSPPCFDDHSLSPPPPLTTTSAQPAPHRRRRRARVGGGGRPGRPLHPGRARGGVPPPSEMRGREREGGGEGRGRAIKEKTAFKPPPLPPPFPPSNPLAATPSSCRPSPSWARAPCRRRAPTCAGWACARR